MVPDHAKIPKELASLKPAFLEFMEKEFLGKNPLKASILEHYLSILLLELYRGTHRDAGKTPTEDLVTDFSDLVETHFREQHHLKFYADKLKVSPKALSGKIQKALGRPAKEIILQRCLLEAKRLLSYSPLSVSEIGYELGFDDPNYFSRFLKTYLRVSAVTFRKNKGHGV
jgi:AraC-like DNA-binding protein